MLSTDNIFNGAHNVISKELGSLESQISTQAESEQSSLSMVELILDLALLDKPSDIARLFFLKQVYTEYKDSNNSIHDKLAFYAETKIREFQEDETTV